MNEKPKLNWKIVIASITLFSLLTFSVGINFNTITNYIYSPSVSGQNNTVIINYNLYAEPEEDPDFEKMALKDFVTKIGCRVDVNDAVKEGEKYKLDIGTACDISNVTGFLAEALLTSGCSEVKFVGYNCPDTG